VDFSPATPRQVDLAADLCRAFDAKLVLFHNVHSLGTGASVGWMWNADHHGDDQATVTARLNECVARIEPGVTVEPLLTQGPTSRAVVAVGEAFDADLVVLTSHGNVADDHVSVSEKLLDEGRRAVLVLHESSLEPRTPHFTCAATDRQVVIAPTDLSEESIAALQVGFELARRLPIELHLVHFLGNGRAQNGRDQAVTDTAMALLGSLVPEDLRHRVRLHVEAGDPADGIPRAAERLSAACIVMGEHTRRPLHRWFTRDTSRAVLHQARCPVWYVPGGRAARVDQKGSLSCATS
jgi:nucleotide-binding universal stress UspA family protein